MFLICRSRKVLTFLKNGTKYRIADLEMKQLQVYKIEANIQQLGISYLDQMKYGGKMDRCSLGLGDLKKGVC